MKSARAWLKYIATLGMLSLLGASMNACSKPDVIWEEEVLLHDGGRVVVTRTVEHGGRHEIRQKAIKEQSLRFTLPGTDETVIWEDKYDKDIGTASFLPMQLEILGNTAYLTAYPMGCLSYNKWGRPNPPYVVFRYQGKTWQRIALQELPAEFTKLNLVFSSPDDAATEVKSNFVSAANIKKLNSTAKQPEFQAILREPMAKGTGVCPKIPGGPQAPIPIPPKQ